MVTCKKISKAELPKLIELSYIGDVDLIEKYHHMNMKGKATFEMAIISTLNNIHDVSKEFDLRYHKVIFDKKPIGYFVTFDGFLHSFAIVKKYRKKDILIGWFNCVKKILGNKFYSMLYDHNTRAINHLVKQGMKIIEVSEEDERVTLLYS